MFSSPEAIRTFLLENIPEHAADIVAVTAQHFTISRVTVHRHLFWLAKQGKITKSGATRQARYALVSQDDVHVVLKLSNNLQETKVWIDHFARLTLNFSENLLNILEYGFTEMLNNARDHSQGKKVEIMFHRQKEKLVITIQDDGIGVFNRISQIYHFDNYKECLLHLTKGKLTTDPINHTGEGIFFSSRSFDEFYLEANGLSFYRNNIEQDWTVEKSHVTQGTKISMIIDINTQRKIVDIFNSHTDEDYVFDATDLLVDLSQLDGERLISRSQAKRLMARLELFTRITLDFSKVKSVGQGFVDEIFRVYTLKHPNVYIQYIHANEEVSFMIKRGLPKKV